MRDKKFYVDIMQDYTEVTGSFTIVVVKIDNKTIKFVVPEALENEKFKDSYLPNVVANVKFYSIISFSGIFRWQSLISPGKFDIDKMQANDAYGKEEIKLYRMMGVIGRLGKVLGPKGLMPNPKSGTVTIDVKKAIAEIKSGKVEYRLDKTNIIHLGFGKVSFGAKKLTENYQVIMDAIIKAKPASAKGQYIKSVAVTTTMGPALRINQK